MSTTHKPHAIDYVLAGGYIALMLVIVTSLVLVRNRSIDTFSSSASQSQWQHWREDVAAGTVDEGRVKRRVSRSTEPPTLVLLRDHFTSSLVGLVAISSVLYASIAFMLRGVLLAPGERPIGHVGKKG